MKKVLKVDNLPLKAMSWIKFKFATFVSIAYIYVHELARLLPQKNIALLLKNEKKLLNGSFRFIHSSFKSIKQTKSAIKLSTYYI